MTGAVLNMNESSRHSDELTENDWSDVTVAVTSLAGKWRQLAINLGLSAGMIDSIAGDFHNNADRLTEVILAWLRHKYNYQKRGLPSWSTLSSAVQPINCALAKDLINQGCVGNCDVIADQKDNMLVNRSKAKSASFSQYNSLGTRQSTLVLILSTVLVGLLVGGLVLLAMGDNKKGSELIWVAIGLLVATILSGLFLFQFFQREGGVTRMYYEKSKAVPVGSRPLENRLHESTLKQRIDLELVNHQVLRTTLNKYNIVVVESYGLNQSTGFWWFRFTFDYELEKGIEVRLTNFKYSNCYDWTLEIVKCEYLGIDSSQRMASFDMADKFINHNELQQIVDCSVSDENLQKYLEENIIPLIVKKIKYTRYLPQFKLYLGCEFKDSKAFMRTFENGLKFLGYVTWLDKTNMPLGSNQLSAIKAAIDESDVIVAWLNPEYMERDTSRAELLYAHSQKKIILAFGTSDVRKYFEEDFEFLNDLHVYDPYQGSFFEVLRRVDDVLFNFEKFPL